MKTVVRTEYPYSDNWREAFLLKENSGQTNIDLGSMDAAQLQRFVRENWGKSISKNYSRTKVDRVVVDVSDQTFFGQRPWKGRFVLALFLVFGSTLITATSFAGNRASFRINSTFNKYQQLMNETASYKMHTAVITEAAEIAKNEQLINLQHGDTNTEPASFPGGANALIEYIQHSLQRLNMAEGNQNVYVQFTIDENGKVGNVEIISGVSSELLSNSAIEIVNKMPDWTPAKAGNKRVASRYILPIRFLGNHSK